MSSEKKRKTIIESDDEDAPHQCSPLPVTQEKRYSTRSQASLSTQKHMQSEDIKDHISRYSKGLDGLSSESEDSDVQIISSISKSTFSGKGIHSSTGSKFFRDSEAGNRREKLEDDRYAEIYSNGSEDDDFIAEDDEDGIYSKKNYKKSKKKTKKSNNDLDDFIVDDDDELHYGSFHKSKKDTKKKSNDSDSDDKTFSSKKRQRENIVRSSSSSDNDDSRDGYSNRNKTVISRKGTFSTSKFFRDADSSRKKIIDDDCSDVNDFIVDDDEVEAEYRQSFKHKTPKHIKNDSSRKREKKQTVIKDIDEEESDVELTIKSKKSKDIRVSRIIADDEDDDSNHSSSSDDEEDVESDSTINDSSFYARINAELDRSNELSETKDSLKSASSALLGNGFSLERPQAFRHYVKYLACVISSLADRFDMNSLSSVQLTQFSMAKKKVEDLICTTRESLLGSGAWKPDFLAEVQCRPVMSVSEPMKGVNRSSTGQKCAACGRSNGYIPEYIVTLTGSPYDAKNLYSTNSWQRYLPKEFNPKSDEMDEEELESSWPLTSHCYFRCRSYHSMLHYKLRLIKRIRNKLRGVFWVLEDVENDKEYLDDEYHRYTKVVEATKKKYTQKLDDDE